jgi:hypothetical protein
MALIEMGVTDFMRMRGTPVTHQCDNVDETVKKLYWY